MTISEAIQEADRTLAHAGISTSRLDAEVLLGYVLQKNRAWLFAHDRDSLPEHARMKFQTVTRRRAQREPLQYIVGRQEFWGLEFTVTPDVLIPRPETELIVEYALPVLGQRQHPLVIDLCTGSGCIAIALANEVPQARIFAADMSDKALSIARDNARKHGVVERIRFLEGDLFQPLEELDLGGRIDMVTANPPYVPSGYLSILQPEVKDHEPAMALVAGPKGTEIHERIISKAPLFLNRGGMLMLEMGIGQAGDVRGLIEESGAYDKPEILKDLAGIDRTIIARKR